MPELSHYTTRCTTQRGYDSPSDCGELWIKAGWWWISALSTGAISQRKQCFTRDLDSLAGFLRCPDVRKKVIPGTSYTPKTDFLKVRKSGIMTTRFPDTGLFACPMTQTRHGVCYLSRKPGRYPSESNKILIFYLTRRILELTQQPQLGWESDTHTIP